MSENHHGPTRTFDRLSAALLQKHAKNLTRFIDGPRWAEFGSGDVGVVMWGGALLSYDGRSVCHCDCGLDASLLPVRSAYLPVSHGGWVWGETYTLILCRFFTHPYACAHMYCTRV